MDLCDCNRELLMAMKRDCLDKDGVPQACAHADSLLKCALCPYTKCAIFSGVYFSEFVFLYKAPRYGRKGMQKDSPPIFFTIS